MKIKFSFGRIFDNNRFIQILSLLIAIVAWFAVCITDSPDTTKSFENVLVDLSLSGSTPESLNLTIIEAAQSTISIRVKGPRNEIGLLTKDDFQVTPILTSVTEAGAHTVPIEVVFRDSTRRDVQNIVIEGYTETIQLTFDRVNSKVYELRPEVSNVVAAENFRIDVDSESVSPKNLSITGPQSELDLIANCAVVYKGNSEQELEDSLIVDGNLVFYDERGNLLTDKQLPHIKYSQQTFSITIPVLMVKDVPVELSFINSDGLDTKKLEVFVDPEYITVAGPKSVVEKRTSITLDPIDVSKMDGRTFSLAVQLSAGEQNMDNIENVTVSFNSDAWDSKSLTISSDHILLMNAPADYEVKLTSESINNVKMYGNQEEIEKLSAKDLMAKVDLKDIDTSTLRVRVGIWVTGGKYVWAVGEYYVYLDVKKR